MSSKMSRKSRALRRRRAEAEQARRRAARLARAASTRRAEAILHPAPSGCRAPGFTRRESCRRDALLLPLSGRARRRLLRLIRAAPPTLLSGQSLQVLAEIARHPWAERPEHLARTSIDAAGFLEKLLAVWPLPSFVMQALLFPGRALMFPADLRWVVGLAAHLGRGRSPRDWPVLSLLTRRMRALFMASSHVAPVPALRHAQIRGAGGDGALATAICGTRLARLQEDEAWWHERIVWMASRRVCLAYQAGALVRWMAALKAGGSDYDPRSRPLASVLRRMESELPLLLDEPDWPASGLRGLTGEPWSLTEIVSQAGLLEEGRAMSHCVWGRRTGLVTGASAVLSLRRDGRRVGTVEVSLLLRRLTEVKGKANRPLRAEERSVVQHWAKREGLATSGCAW